MVWWLGWALTLAVRVHAACACGMVAADACGMDAADACASGGVGGTHVWDIMSLVREQSCSSSSARGLSASRRSTAHEKAREEVWGHNESGAGA